MADEVRAVLDAAENWLRAREAVLAEDESRQRARDVYGIALTERACDQADSDLTLAVLEWRKRSAEPVMCN